MRRFLVMVMFLTATLTASAVQSFAMTGAVEVARPGSMAVTTAYTATKASDKDCPHTRHSRQPCCHHSAGCCLACSTTALPALWSPGFGLGVGTRVKTPIWSESSSSLDRGVDPPVPRSSARRSNG